MKIKTFKVFGLIALMFLGLTSCEDETLDLNKGFGVVPQVSGINPATFDSNNKTTTFVRFTVSIPEGQVAPSEVIIVASYKGDGAKKQVASVTTFPSTIDVSLQQVATALGKTLAQINAGDVINMQVLTVVGGKTYQSSAAFNAPVVCAYAPAIVTGTYRAVSAGWAVDGTVTITVDPVDQYKVYVSGLPELDGAVGTAPLTMTINPLNFAVTAPGNVIASTFFQYTNLNYAGSGTVDTCTGNYTMSFTITVTQGSFGAYSFTFTKL